MIPSGELQLIFHYRAPFKEITRHNHNLIQPQCSICGQQTGYKDIITSDSVGMMAAVFYPYALSAFFHSSMSEFTNQSISLDDVFPTKTRELQARMTETTSPYSRIGLIENFLLGRLSIPYDFSVAREATTLLSSTSRNLTVKEVACKLNISKRQLERVFLKNVGISPKKFSHIVRFNAAIKRFKNAESLTMLTYEAGYFDSSHLIRDFKEFTGLSPKKFFKYPCQIENK